MGKVTFKYAESIRVNYSQKIKLKKFVETIFRDEKVKLQQVQYIFCSDDYLLAINKQFLQHDYYTDIITFDLSEKDSPVVAEIYVSVDRVRDNALQNSLKLYLELERVIFHGALHMCGYQDKSKLDKLKMTDREDYYLEKYHVTRGTL